MLVVVTVFTSCPTNRESWLVSLVSPLNSIMGTKVISLTRFPVVWLVVNKSWLVIRLGRGWPGCLLPWVGLLHWASRQAIGLPIWHGRVSLPTKRQTWEAPEIGTSLHNSSCVLSLCDSSTHAAIRSLLPLLCFAASPPLCYSVLLCHCPSATLLCCVQHSWLLDALVICSSSL
jgi:hypothetical protein